MATVEALYQANRCSVIVGGLRREGFATARGIRQCCPLSPLLYVVTADSLLRAIAEATPEATVRGFADDTAAVLTQLPLDWPRLQHVFARFEAASGLALNLGKTVLIPLGARSCAEVRDALQHAHDRWRGVQVATWGRYLGFAIGPGRAEHSRDRPRTKFCDRLRDWRWSDLGLHLATRVYNIFVLPVLLFVAQLEHPPPDLLALVEAATVRIAPGPHRWILHEDLIRLTPLLGFPVQVRCLADTAAVTQLRVATWEAHLAGGLRPNDRQAALDRARRDSPFQARRDANTHWLDAAHCSVLREARRRLAARGVTVGLLEHRLSGACLRPWPQQVELRVRKRFQRAAVAAIPPPHDALLEGRLRHKLERWHLPGLPPRVARTVHRRLRSLRGAVQPRVHAACIRVLFNGVLTARRYQDDPHALGCRLGCPAGADVLEHYARCPVLRDVGARFLALALPAQAFHLAFFFATPALVDEAGAGLQWRRMALLHYALHRTINAARHHPAWNPESMAVPALGQALREGVSPLPDAAGA